MLAQSDRVSYFTHLGKLLAVATRHQIMVPFPLPRMLWQALAGECVSLRSLQQIYPQVVGYLNQVADCVDADTPDLLVAALLNVWPLPTPSSSSSSSGGNSTSGIGGGGSFVQ
jgi:hypothetical protein